MVDQWVKDLVGEHTPKESVIDGKSYTVISEPNVGDIVYFKAFHNGDGYNIGDFYLVEIKGGYYWGERGLSNFWYWYRLDDEGNRISEEHGYGNFMVIK